MTQRLLTAGLFLLLSHTPLAADSKTDSPSTQPPAEQAGDKPAQTVSGDTQAADKTKKDADSKPAEGGSEPDCD